MCKINLSVSTLFHKYESYLKPEFNEENWIEYHRSLDGENGIKKSIELIGNGEITDKGDESFMYKEMLKNETLIFIVHAKLTKSPYGGAKGYYYEIGIYSNDPTLHQIGGGYGTSGIISVRHTNLFGYCDNDIIHYNKYLISNVCKEIKGYIEENF